MAQKEDFEKRQKALYVLLDLLENLPPSLMKETLKGLINSSLTNINNYILTGNVINENNKQMMLNCIPETYLVNYNNQNILLRTFIENVFNDPEMVIKNKETDKNKNCINAITE